jgi:protein tyrosine phosphatase (PTP) superfamily phosphohydrolase (DUF442 family)
MDVYPIKWVTENLAVSYAPRSVENLQTIRTSGIRAIVNLCAECYDLHETEKEADFDVYHLPVEDEAAPVLEELDQLVAWMGRQIESGNPVLVHCRYGIGRTGTVVLAFLVQAGIDFKTARKMMAHTPAWPSSRAQKELIDRYIMRISEVSEGAHFSGKRTGQSVKFFERLKAALKWHD